MATHYRLYLGNLAGKAALDRIMETVRAEYRSDEVGWYALERASVGNDDHPRNPGHRWEEVEGDE